MCGLKLISRVIKITTATTNFKNITLIRNTETSRGDAPKYFVEIPYRTIIFALSHLGYFASIVGSNSPANSSRSTYKRCIFPCQNYTHTFINLILDPLLEVFKMDFLLTLLQTNCIYSGLPSFEYCLLV